MSDLLDRYGGAAKTLRKLCRTNPSLQGALLTAKPELRHAIAIAVLADGSRDAEALASAISSGSSKELLKRSGALAQRVKPGMLRRLSATTLDLKTYEVFAQMMESPRFARQVIHHSARLTRRDLTELSRLPPNLRDLRLLRFKDFHCVAANLSGLLRLLLLACSDTTEASLHTSILKTEASEIEDWAQAYLLEHADLPAMEFMESDFLRPIRTTGELRACGLEFQNCLATKVREILQGRTQFGIYQDKARAIVELRRWLPTGWYVHRIWGFENGPVPPALEQRARAHLEDLGLFVLPKDPVRPLSHRWSTAAFDMIGID